MLYSDQGRLRRGLAAASDNHTEDGDSKARTLPAGGDHHTQRRYREAEEAVTKALAIWISIGNEEGQVGALLPSKGTFKSQSRDDEEEDALIQAEVICAGLGHGVSHATTSDQFEDVHLAQETFDEAERCYRLAQAIFSSMDDVRGEATELLSLRVLYGHQD